MRSPKSDFQQYEAYAWEDSFTKWAGAGLKDKELRRALVRACRLYRVPVPRLQLLTRDNNKKKVLASVYDPNTHEIRLRPRHRRLNVLLHEAAHGIVDWLFGNTGGGAAHGPVWLGVYIELLVRFKIAPRDMLEFAARQAGLKFSKHCATGAIRKHYARRVRNARRMRRLLSLYD